MEWEITINNEHKYVEIVTKGSADNDSSIKMAKSLSETMRKHRITKALIDHRDITNVSGSVIEVYDRPKLFKIIGVILGIKIAEIINPEHLDHFKFLETVCINQGYRFSKFYEKQKALEWLLD
jgi:hypothetical protein